MKDSADYLLPRASLARLEAAKRTRPRPAGVFRTVANIAAGLAIPVSCAATLGGFDVAPLVLVGCIGWSMTQSLRGRTWKRRFSPHKAQGGRLEVKAVGGPDEPTLIYSMMEANLGAQRVHLDFKINTPVSIAPRATPLLIPTFDKTLGVDGDELARGLLGSDFCSRCVQWYATEKIVVRDGVLVIPLDDGTSDFDKARPYAQPFQTFATRLQDPPCGLAELARNDTPFHAARAWFLLATRFPYSALELLEAIEPDAVNHLIGKMILDEEHPIDLVLDWPIRADVFRGMIGVMTTVRSSSLVERLLTTEPDEEASAIALADMLDAARIRLDQWPEGAVFAWSRLGEWLADHGETATLEWLATRATYPKLRKESDQLAGRIKARLHVERAGRLALEPDARTGALSDAHVGEVSLVDPSTDPDQAG